MSLSRLFSSLLSRLFPSRRLARREADADTYLAAAERIHEGTNSFACTAIGSALNDDSRFFTDRDRLVDAFSDWFQPYDGRSIWWGSTHFPANQEARILALLLMAEITLGGD